MNENRPEMYRVTNENKTGVTNVKGQNLKLIWCVPFAKVLLVET